MPIIKHYVMFSIPKLQRHGEFVIDICYPYCTCNGLTLTEISNLMTLNAFTSEAVESDCRNHVKHLVEVHAKMMASGAPLFDICSVEVGKTYPYKLLHSKLDEKLKGLSPRQVALFTKRNAFRFE